MIRLVIWDLGDTLTTSPPGIQDKNPLDRDHDIKLRPAVAEVLRTLHEKGYRQAVLSNTAVSDSETARCILKKLGIEAYFDHIHATASELDSSRPGKPDPVVFQRVLNTLGIVPDEAVMVGHSWDTDILGANRSGVHAIWLQNPEVCARQDFSTPVVTPPWILPVWDVRNVPEAIALLIGEGRLDQQAAAPRTKGFSHVTIDVSNLRKSLEFYVHTLGMRLVHQGRRDAYLEWGTAWVCLQERPDMPPQSPQLGVDHVAFYIAPEEFHAAVETLRQAKIPIVRGPVERGGGWTVNFLDPDGTQLEFHTGTLAERMKVWT